MEQNNKQVTKTLKRDGAFLARDIKKYFRDQKPVFKEGSKFVDDYFPPNVNSILAKDKRGEFVDKEAGPVKSAEINSDELEWKRIDEIFSKSLIFEDSIEFNDIKQGNIGNCYFLSSLSALTEMPYLIYQIFRTKEKNDQGYFEVVLYIDGEWQVVVIDDYFVVRKGSTDFKFTKPNGRELWTIILEKAWAKVNGGYANTISGNPCDALMALTGFSVERIFHEKIDPEKLWKTVLQADRSDNIMCTSTSTGKETIEVGLVENHAYTLIAAKEGNFDGQSLRMLKIRNPWGNKEWNGNYSDKSKLWTAEKRDFFDMPEDKDDGCFCILLEDFIKYFTDTCVCYIMYDCNVKNFRIEGNDLNHAHVYSIYIDKPTRFTASAIFRHWRFNREARKDSHPTSVLLCKYDDERVISDLTGCFSANFNAEVVKDLEKGLYCVWIFNNYEETVEPKPNNYIVKFSGNSDFRVRYCGVDTGFNLLKEIFKFGLYERYSMDIAEVEGDYWDRIDNSFDQTGIGYVYVKLVNPDVCQMWTCESGEMVNMWLFPPHTGQKEIKFLVKTQYGEYVALGMRTKQYGTYWFNIVPSFSTYPGVCENNFIKDDKNLAYLKPINFSALLPKATKKDKITKDYYDYHSASVVDSKNDLEFGHIDVNLVEIEELKSKYPQEMEEVLAFEPHPDISPEGLNWSSFNYEGSGLYIGQYLNGKDRQGRGIYRWHDDGSYYVGYWVGNQKEKRGKFVNSKGKVTYEGEVSGGEKNGTGTTFFPSGDTYTGQFENGSRNGPGTYKWKSGGQWRGQSVKNQLHGPGVYIDADGEESELTFNNGVMEQ